jgi:RimJ/RimL family protein N-acetyltransferase
MNFPLLTPRLSIEPLKLSDLQAFVSYRQDPEIARFQSWDTTYSAEQALELVESQIGVLHPEPGQWLQLAIHEKMSGALVGDLALHSLVDSDSVFELGFTLASNHQGKGFAREAASKLISYLFADLAAKKVIAHTDRRNAPSVRLLAELGFKFHPSKSWTENFKNELVTVDYFERLSDPGK